MRDGEVVLTAGTEITPGVIGILATVKAARMQVRRRPRVAILSTGDELEGINEPLDLNKIPDSNTYALMAQVQALGITPVLLGIARDDPAELEQYLKIGLEYDVLLVSGGTSVGVHDYVRPTIEKLSGTTWCAASPTCSTEAGRAGQRSALAVGGLGGHVRCVGFLAANARAHRM